MLCLKSGGQQPDNYLFILLIDDLGLFMPLEPHHVLGVEPPALFLECLGCEVLRLRALHVVEHEEQRLRRQSLEELHGVRMGKQHLWTYSLTLPTDGRHNRYSNFVSTSNAL